MNEPIRDLVLEIYDTVTEPRRWAAVLDRLVAELDARGMVLFELVEEAEGRRLNVLHHSSIFKPEIIAPYMSAFGKLEIEENELLEALIGEGDPIEIVRDTAMMPADELALRPNVMALRGLDIRHRAFGMLDKDMRWKARFTLQHGSAHGPLTDFEEARLKLYLPHIAKALDLGRPAAQLAAAQHGLLAAMNRLKIGLCVLDSAGRVVLANEEFDRQRDASGAFRIDQAGVLGLGEPKAQKRFAALVDDILAHGGHGGRPRKDALALPIGGGAALCVDVAPYGQIEGLDPKGFGGAIVYSLDTSQPVATNTVAMAQVFALTAAERELAELLAEGLTNAQIAGRRGRSVATVNAQVKTLLSKTNCANRTQFARLMMSFGADYIV